MQHLIVQPKGVPVSIRQVRVHIGKLHYQSELFSSGSPQKAMRTDPSPAAHRLIPHGLDKCLPYLPYTWTSHSVKYDRLTSWTRTLLPRWQPHCTTFRRLALATVPHVFHGRPTITLKWFNRFEQQSMRLYTTTSLTCLVVLKSTCHQGRNCLLVCVQDPSWYLPLVLPSTARADLPP